MLKQAIVIRKDLKLGKGKLAAQAAHAAILASEKSDLESKWKKEGQRKIVVYCKDFKELLLLYKTARANDLAVALVEDAGLTQVRKGTKTCIAIGPAPEEKIDKITGKLKLV